MLNIGIIMTILSPYLAIVPGILIWYKILKDKIAIELNPLNIGMFILFLLGVISGIANGSIFSIIASFGILLLFSISVYLQYNITDESEYGRFLYNIWSVSLIAVTIGIIEKIASYFVDMTWVSDLFFKGPYVPTVENYRIYSTLGNPNVAGGWFAAMVLLGIYFFNKEKSDKKFLYFISIVLFVFGLIFTGSKGATMGLELGVLVYALLLKRDKKFKITLLVLFAMVLVLAFLSPEMNHPIGSRDTIWEQSIHMFIEKPILGYGIFGLWDLIGKTHSHNIWLSMLTIFGIGGLFTYLWIKVYMYKSLWILHKNNSEFLPLLASIQALILGHGMVDFIIMSPQGGILFIASSALIVSMTRTYFEYPIMEFGKFRILRANDILKR